MNAMIWPKNERNQLNSQKSASQLIRGACYKGLPIPTMPRPTTKTVFLGSPLSLIAGDLSEYILSETLE